MVPATPLPGTVDAKGKPRTDRPQNRMNVQLREQQGDRLRDQDWFWWTLVPIYPYGKRQTLRREVVPGTIWTFEQVQGIFSVVVPIRMTVVRLAAGGLLIYAPIAPTRECLRLLQELIDQHGPVQYLVLPTTSGLEHKVFVAPFARRFPTAQVLVTPQQWSFPLNLPLSWLGFPPERTQVLSGDFNPLPFAEEFDLALLGPIALGLGHFSELALLHRRSRTLLLTDTLVSIPETPPEIVQLDPAPLLYHAKDDVVDAPVDTPENRRKGWQRISLFAFYFRPCVLDVVDLLPSLQDARKAGDRSRQNYFGWYPFRWQPDWQQTFAALRGNGRPFVAPILQQLILNRAPQETLDWANRIARWNFERIIPCHFDAPIATTPQQFRQAFAFLEKSPLVSESAPLPREDFALLQDIDRGLTRFRITPPAREKV